jgi:hypothetical protein
MEVVKGVEPSHKTWQVFRLNRYITLPYEKDHSRNITEHYIKFLSLDYHQYQFEPAHESYAFKNLVPIEGLEPPWLLTD